MQSGIAVIHESNNSKVRVNDSSGLIQINFMLDENVYTYNGQVQTIFYGFSMVGGLMGIIMALAKVILEWVQRHLFLIDVI